MNSQGAFLGQATLHRFDTLDALSRQRALTNEESEDLERCLERLIYGPPFPGLRQALARRGMLQDRRRRSQRYGFERWRT